MPKASGRLSLAYLKYRSPLGAAQGKQAETQAGNREEQDRHML